MGRMVCWLLTPALTGCFAVADLDRFQSEGDACNLADLAAPRDFTVALSGFEEHVDQRVEVRLVEDQRVVRAVAVLDGLDSEPLLPRGEARFRMPRAVPPGDVSDLEVRIFVDIDRSGAFETGGDDLSWVRGIECDNGSFEFELDDTTSDFNDPPVEEKGTFTLSLRAMGPHSDGEQHIELMLRDDSAEGQPAVGYYRIPGIAEPDHFIVIPNVTTPGNSYTYEFYADFNKNQRYTESLPRDHSWRREASADASGLGAEFMHVAEFEDLDLFERDD